jgi:ABC-2 type transport system ATP-binding protein
LRAAGGAVLLATHAFDEVEQLADRVVVLLGGRVVHEGTPTAAALALERLAGAAPAEEGP